MKQFRLVDNVLGWLTFLIAAFVYCSTIEPTASFWDCPEFITTGSKLEVGHPPGAPFFMLTANLFSQFASDPSQVARMVNTMSALLSAACILFLFWSITHLVRRLLTKSWDDLDMTKLIAIEASGLVGALIYTFSDTFWFSAVEGEVYAYSSAFTAVVFWLILKWEEHADEPHSDRWLVLIMYMTGLSIGVHLLNLLCLPAIGLVWYYKRFPNANAKGSLLALLVSAVILAGVLYGVVPGIITVGGWFELFFVNTLHMPFNTGVFIYIILLIASMVWAIYETQNATEKNWKRQNIAFLLGFALLGVPFYGWGWSAFIIGILVLGLVGYAVFSRSGGKNPIPLISARLKNTALLCMLMLMIGYSTYAVIVIRSSANPPMDQNSPEDIFTLGSYLSRDQYGYRPLLWGQAYSSELKYNEDGTLARDEGDLWDTGLVASSRQLWIAYGGKPLKSNQRVWWKVRVSTTRGDSPWSQSSRFGIGLLEEGQWGGRWIGLEQTQPGEQAGQLVPRLAARYLRRSFAVEAKRVRHATAYVAGLGLHEFYVNGQRVGDDYLVPNFTNYTTRPDLDKGGLALDAKFTAYRVLYLAYDITKMLRNGDNATGAMLGDGFYRSTTHWVKSFGTP